MARKAGAAVLASATAFAAFIFVSPLGAQTIQELRVDFDTAGAAVQRYTGGYGVGAPTVFLRDYPGDAIPATSVQHSMDGDVQMTHVVTDRRDLTYTARDHVMAHPFGDGGFQIIHQTLGSFVHSDRSATVSVDVSTAGVSGRKWAAFWFYAKGSLPTEIPGDPKLLEGLPVDPGYSDTVRDHLALISVPTDALLFKPEVFNGAVGWGGWNTSGARFGEHWLPIPVEQSSITRTPHRFVFEGSRVEVWIGNTLMWSDDNAVPASWAGREIVAGLQFVDYNSKKDGEAETTWHWDNVIIQAEKVFAAPGSSGVPVSTDTPTPMPTSSATAFPTASATAAHEHETPTATASATATTAPPSSVTPSPEGSATATPGISTSPTASPTATTAPSPSATPSPTETVGPWNPPATATPTPTMTPEPQALCEVFGRVNGIPGWRLVDCETFVP